MRFLAPVDVVFNPVVEREYWVDPTDQNPTWIQRTICAERFGKPVDPWNLRARLLTIEDTAQGAVNFLNGLGQWDYHDHVSYEEFRKWKALIPHLMRLKPKYWEDLAATHDCAFVEYAISVGYSFGFKWRRGSSAIVSVRPETVLDAILVSIAVDHARGAKFRWCSASDCGQPFLVESRKPQKYCGRECCHRCVVRRSRSRAKKASRVLPEAAPPPVTREAGGIARTSLKK